MKYSILGLLVFFFLILLAPVLAFSMVAPWAMKTILLCWGSLVLVAGLIAGGFSLWVYLESR
ncbi:MAG: hypothetical protein WDA20_01055 [Desulfuromonadales bacterium]